MKNRMEGKRSNKSNTGTSREGGSVAAVGRIVHVVHGIHVGIACAITWCTSLRSIGTDRMHIPRWSRSRGCQTVGALGVTHGRI